MKDKFLKILQGKILVASWRNKRLVIPQLIFLLIIPVIFMGYQIRNQLLEGQWKTSTSQEYGYQIDYPANGHISIYTGSGYKGKKYIRSYFTVPREGYVEIYQNPSQNPDLYTAAEWGDEIISFIDGMRTSQLQETVIGQDNYPTLMLKFTQTDFLGKIRYNRIYYVASNEQVFAIRIADYQDGNGQTMKKFERILNSFKLLELENSHSGLQPNSVIP